MFKKIVTFIKYNNAAAIIFSLIFGGVSATFAASPTARSTVFASSSVVSSVDNHLILAADFSNFNFDLKINSVTEDSTNYYVDYSYNTMAIVNSMWQNTVDDQTLTVDKQALGTDDLGLYVAKKLADNVNDELYYLKRVQTLQEAQGASNKVVTTQYSGLIGKFLDTKREVFQGYNPVVAAVADSDVSSTPVPLGTGTNVPPISNTQNNNSTSNSPTPSNLQQIVDQALQNSNNPGSVAGNTPGALPPVITLTGPATINLNVGDTYTEQGATATDAVDTTDTVAITGTVDTTTAGTYTIDYNATDAAGNKATQVTRTVIVRPLAVVTPPTTTTPPATPDTTPPVITLTGPATINLNVGDTYTEQGATATDAVDTTDTVAITGTVDTTTAGTYTIDYNATDAAGNKATQVTRTVIVSALAPSAPPATDSGSTTSTPSGGGN